MKKAITLFLAIAMSLSCVACGSQNQGTAQGSQQEEEQNQPVSDGTLGQELLVDFYARMAENPEQSAQELADGIITNENILFAGQSAPVEPGLLTGFGNKEIIGFQEGVMFAPVIGTIPFVGYIFVLEDGADVDAFKDNLETNANLRWNICTEAEQKIIDSIDNTVFFLMCPKSLEE